MFDSVCVFAKRFSLTLPLGYIGYFVLGYELGNGLVKREDITGFLAATSLVMIVCIATLTHYVSASQGSMTELFYDYMSPTVVLYSACLFLLAKIIFSKNHYFNSSWYSTPIVLMSKYSLAIYMFHEFILIFIQKLGINPTLFHPLIAVPAIAIGIYLSSFLAIHACAKIPFFRKNMM